MAETKTAQGLVDYAKAQLGKPYWYGTYGNTASKGLYDYKKKQYPKYYTAKDFPAQYGQRVHDCVGLIKGYLWSDTPTSDPKYNKAQDKNANGMYDACEVKGSINTLPEIRGLLLWRNGHIGVYIGNGYAIEARGHEYGVVKTRVKDRNWTNWAKCVYIKYDDVSTDVKTGDKVTIEKGAVYGGASKGVKVPERYTDGDVFNVNKVQINNGQKEARLTELVSWVPVKYLHVVK